MLIIDWYSSYFLSDSAAALGATLVSLLCLLKGSLIYAIVVSPAVVVTSPP